MVSGIAARIGASHDEVGCKMLKTIEAHQPQECPDTILPAVNITQGVVNEQPQSTKTKTASVPRQDQDNILTMKGRHDQDIQQEGSNPPVTSIHQDSLVIVSEPNECRSQMSLP